MPVFQNEVRGWRVGRQFQRLLADVKHGERHRLSQRVQQAAHAFAKQRVLINQKNIHDNGQDTSAPRVHL